MNTKPILLVDGHNLLFRMFYGIQNSIKNSNGIEIKGLIGFIGGIKKLALEFEPYSIVVVFDSETSRYNNEQIDETYKANRKDYNNIEESANPFSQLPFIKLALDYLNITNFEVIDNEADDYIASVVKTRNNENFVIVSTDTDFIQLINQNISMYVQRGKNSILYDNELVIKKYNVLPEQYVAYKSLVGDKCDNIDGVKGIGKVTATEILSYGTIENFIEKSEKQRLINLLLSNYSKINKNQKLILLNNNIDTSQLIFNKLSEKVYQEKVHDIIRNIGLS